MGVLGQEGDSCIWIIFWIARRKRISSFFFVNIPIPSFTLYPFIPYFVLFFTGLCMISCQFWILLHCIWTVTCNVNSDFSNAVASEPNLILPFSEKWVLRTWSEEVLDRCSGGQTISLLFIYNSSESIFIAKLPLSGRYFLASGVGNWFCKYIPMIILFLFLTFLPSDYSK